MLPFFQNELKFVFSTFGYKHSYSLHKQKRKEKLYNEKT